mmetsp:Transcript_13736/g.26313  ORF Transcript_13736/g.26313 Transcript_13736/m.26313 type:complete len:235 (-) Transcript_13736:120-824(-)
MWKQLSRVVLRQQQHQSRQHALSLARRSFVSPTPASCLAATTCPLPALGDSITEGTVVEWLVAPGQAVQADDVVAMVETDKVTIEIKADISGVVTKHFPAIDETVEVGAPLYEIDTGATASNTSASTSTSSGSADKSPKAEATPPPPAAKEQPPTKTTTTAPAVKKQQRNPSIQFLGKEGWAARLTPAPVVELPPIHPMFGRPAFSEEEMEAIMLGGAEQAPKVVVHSSGAKFA